ncbi:MAG: phosphatase PAP2 family protein [Ignavibacteria bacterium]
MSFPSFNLTIKVFISIYVLIFCSNLHAFDSTKIKVKKSIWDNITDDAVIFAKDGGAFFTLPLHFSGNDWLYFGGAVSLTALSMTLDREGKNLGRSTHKTFNRDLWDVSTVYGFVQYPSILAGAIYAAGLFTGEEDARVTGRLMIEALAYSGITVMLARYITGRYRPYYSDNPWKYTWFQSSNDTQSFPSGHTVVAFATSTVLAERIDNIWARIGLYGLASLTAYGRVLNNQHWISDVLVGGLLGFGTGYFVVQKEKERWSSSKIGRKGSSNGFPGSGRLSLSPTFNGISFVYTF